MHLQKMFFIATLLISVITNVVVQGELMTSNKREDRKQRLPQVLNNTLSADKMDMIKRSWFDLLEENSKIKNSKENYEKEERKLKRKMKSKNKEKYKKYQLVESKTPKKPPVKPGATSSPIHSDEVMSQFRTIIKVTADRNMAANKKQEQIRNTMATGLPDVSSAFMLELQSNVVVPKKTFAFLKKFKSGRTGTFIRGQGIDLHNGRFIAPYSAIYRFQSTLHIQRSLKTQSLKPNNAVTARICIENECNDNMSLYFRSGISSNSKIFTIDVSGYLYLQKDQYVETIVENTANNRVTVLAGSLFTGFLVGV